VVTSQFDQGTYGIGRLTLLSDLSGHTGWTYDQHGRVLLKSQYTNKMTLNTSMSYDAAGRLASTTYPSGVTVAASYDPAGRISALKSGATALVGGVTYLPFGPAESWTQGNGGVYSRTFDTDGRIASIAFGGSAMALAYDPAGRITGIAETGLPSKSFGYDALDRLTGYTSGATSLTYGYDADGNRTSLGTGGTTIAYNIDPASNRLLSAGPRSFTYDAAGNLTVDSQLFVIYGYTYDASGRLVNAKTGGYTTAYTNDGSGERVTRSGYGAAYLPGGNERFAYDQAGHPLGEYDGKGATVQETVWLGDLPVAVLMPAQPPYYIAPDQLGSPRQIANAAGSTVWRWDHDPFGNGAPTGSIAYNLRFPGQYYDQETGLNYNGFRDYDPSTDAMCRAIRLDYKMP
jgi:YD repeat-containing protein